MNILVLAPFFPYPLDQGGKIRVFNLVKSLASHHDVTLACLSSQESPESELVAKFCKEVVVVGKPENFAKNFLRFLVSGNPFNCERFRSAPFSERLQQLIAANRFDLVQIEFSMLWQYAHLFKGIPVVLDAHNIEHHNVRQIGKSSSNPVKRWLYRLEEERLKNVEERAWRECAICFTVSDKERREIAERTGNQAKVITAANGVDLERFALSHREDGGKRILFLGGMDYAPNLDAAQFFLEEIFPKIQLEEPESKLLLVGRELARLGNILPMRGVECHESVTDVLPYFYQVDLLAVPLRMGAGTRIKVLEAMAAGLPVVTTSKGCEGIAVQHGRELLVANSREDFAAACLKLLKHPEQGRELAQQARRLVEERYAWEITARMMDQAYRGFLAPRVLRAPSPAL